MPSNSTLLSILLLVAAVLLMLLRRRWATAQPSTAGLPNLVGSPPPRPAFPLVRRSLAGIGTIELPSGVEWEAEDNTLYHEESGLTLVIQNQPQGMAGYERAYLESYNEVNTRDAPRWQRGPEQLGQVQGITTARTTGRFDNGTAMVTRDYLFFAKNSTVLFQSRVPASHAKYLEIIDYLASTFQPN